MRFLDRSNISFKLIDKCSLRVESPTFALRFSCIDSVGLDPDGTACGPLPLRPSACLSAPVEYAAEGGCALDAMMCDSDGGPEEVSKLCLDYGECEAEEERRAQATQASCEQKRASRKDESDRRNPREESEKKNWKK